jgi:hypothetical protein
MLFRRLGENVFRLLKLKPPNGWNAVAWELAIVTLGVIIALAAQQWAEGRSWQGKVKASKVALRGELAEHYNYAVEFRVVYPCLQAQLDRLRNRVLSSGLKLEPAPTYKEPDDDYVFRIPVKLYPTDVWEEAISDGVAQRFEPALRRQLAGHYAQLGNVRDMFWANNEAEQALMVLSRPMPLDPAFRSSMVREIEQLSGRLQYLDIINGQVIDYIQRIEMVPPAREARTVTERYGTFHFCKAHRLPMRSFADAMQAVEN